MKSVIYYVFGFHSDKTVSDKVFNTVIIVIRAGARGKLLPSLKYLGKIKNFQAATRNYYLGKADFSGPRWRSTRAGQSFRIAEDLFLVNTIILGRK